MPLGAAPGEPADLEVLDRQVGDQLMEFVNDHVAVADGVILFDTEQTNPPLE